MKPWPIRPEPKNSCCTGSSATWRRPATAIRNGALGLLETWRPGARPRSPTDYRRAFPAATYEEYKPLITRVMAGEVDLLLCEPPVGWAITRGTTAGESKFIPMTPTDLRMRVSRRPGHDELRGRHQASGAVRRGQPESQLPLQRRDRPGRRP